MDANVPFVIPGFVRFPEETYAILRAPDVKWFTVKNAREELFFAHKPSKYKYDAADDAFVYESVPYLPIVDTMEHYINNYFRDDSVPNELQCNMNVCFMNYYATATHALNWHSDNDPMFDVRQPIMSVSLGQPREIWVKPIEHSGPIPKEWRFLLPDGSLFYMPPGFQQTHMHKIPKGDRPMGGRVSLTFRSVLA